MDARHIAALKQLPPDERLILTLRIVERRTMPEVARIIRRSIQEAQQIQAHGLHALLELASSPDEEIG